MDRQITERLARVYREQASHVRYDQLSQLAYRHMIVLVEIFEGWAQDPKRTPEQTATLLGMAESYRTLAEEVGPSWDPPEPAMLTVVGWLARTILEEPTEGRTPSSRKTNSAG